MQFLVVLSQLEEIKSEMALLKDLKAEESQIRESMQHPQHMPRKPQPAGGDDGAILSSVDAGFVIGILVHSRPETHKNCPVPANVCLTVQLSFIKMRTNEKTFWLSTEWS